MDQMPRFAVLYSDSAAKYLRYKSEDDGVEELNMMLSAKSDQAWNPFSKFEMVKSKAHPTMVHIRCCYSNRYLRRQSDTEWWIVAAANEPEEDQTLWSATLFQPEFLSDAPLVGLVRLLHVQLGRYAEWYDSSSTSTTADLYSMCIWANSTDPNNNSKVVFQVSDWESLVTLPKHLCFRGDNGLYLGLVEETKSAAIRVMIRDEDDKSVANEVVALPDGSFGIKNVSVGAFWRLHDLDGYIWAQDNSTTPTEEDSLFRAAKVDDKTIVLRSEGNNQLCKRDTDDRLKAHNSDMTNEARLELTELISSRSITNIKFHLNDGWINKETCIIVLNPGEEVSNDTSEPKTFNFEIPYTDIKTSTWTATISSLKLGPAVVIHPYEIPEVTEFFTMGMRAPYRQSYTWGEKTRNESKMVKVEHLVLQPMTKMRWKLMATLVTCDVPLSYTRHDVLDKVSAEEEVYVMEDGVYRGSNYINLTVETTPVIPITRNK